MSFVNNKDRERIYWRLMVAVGADGSGEFQGSHFRECRAFLQDIDSYCIHNRDGISVGAFDNWWIQEKDKQEYRNE